MDLVVGGDLSERPDLPRAKSRHRPEATRDYRDLYADAGIELVRQVCSREISALGYRF